jgi:hypothetical protein
MDMRVVAKGWAREGGDKAIVPDADFEGEYQYPQGGFGDGEPCLQNRSNGDIELSIGPNAIALSGNYQVIVTLTKEEVLNLVAESYKEDTFANAIKGLFLAMHRVSRKKPVPFRTRWKKGGKDAPILDQL